MTIQEALDYLNQYRNAGNHIHREAMDMAIEVLEKKIAEKPIEKWTGDEWVIKCPVFREALQIADRLEQADAEEMAIRIDCSKCRHTICRRNPKYEGEQDLFEVGCDLFGRFKNDGILVLADIRGDNNDI